MEISLAESSLPFAKLPKPTPTIEDDEEIGHEVGMNPRRREPSRLLPRDPVLQPDVPTHTMPVTALNIIGQGNTNTPTTMSGTPPDTNGAVGPNHYVQVVNSGIAIWNKSGTVAASSAKINTLFTGYVGTNAGNACATNNDGDPVVVYDPMADRWLITQFSLPNANSGPNFQCVAVSKTADPTGAYWLYDYQYAGLNDYGKFGVWPDAYYATFNMFNLSGGGDADVCAYDRVSMLQGRPAAQQCFQQTGGVFGLLPVSMDGKVKPPRGEPGFIASLGNTVNDAVDLWKFHVDWVTPANTTLDGPTTLPVAAFAQLCNGGACVSQPSPGNKLASLADRPMFRLSYRNFGTHESLLMNHAVSTSGGGGVRWYEIRSPNATPVVFQQGTYSPNDASFRWMASIAQDQAQGMALGFTISSTTRMPSMAWTGRIASDATGVMGQGETVVDNGTGVETGKFSNNQLATRWGDYSNMTVDPVDDCTFWYTSEIYHVTGPIPKTWDTQIASFKFANCAANDFSLTLSPATQNVALGAQATFTVTTAATAGTPESIALSVQDLPTGVSAAFNPATVTAGTPSVLTLTAAANAPLTGSPAPFFTVIGKAPSAVHPAYAQLAVGPTCVPATTCPPGNDCGSASDSCGGTVSCGACASSQTCVANRCTPNGADAGVLSDSGAVDAGSDDSGSIGARDSGTGVDAASDSGSVDDGGTGGGDNSGGCGCRAAETRTTPSSTILGLGGLAMVGALRWRRRRSRAPGASKVRSR